jgi:hypothetical protein
LHFSGEAKAYEITNHDMMFIKRNGVEVALDLDANAVAERFAKAGVRKQKGSEKGSGVRKRVSLRKQGIIGLAAGSWIET